MRSRKAVADTSPLFEAGNTFRSYKRRDDPPPQRPKIICWDLAGLGGKGKRSRLAETEKKYKFTIDAGGPEIPVYVMKLMDGLSVMSTRELRARGINI